LREPKCMKFRKRLSVNSLNAKGAKSGEFEIQEGGCHYLADRN
jgi:hypothetical protein